MKRLTEKQRDAYILMMNKPDGSLRSWAKELGISHTSFEDRLRYMENKGYLVKENGRFKFVAEGIEQVMNDEIHDRFIRTKK